MHRRRVRPEPGRSSGETQLRRARQRAQIRTRESPAGCHRNPSILTGTLSGLGGANYNGILQASRSIPSRLHAIGVPGSTDAFGRFAFRVANLSRSTQFRVVTADPRPIYARLTVPAAVRVTLRVRSNGRPGLVRLYGRVTPGRGWRAVASALKAGAAGSPPESKNLKPPRHAYVTVVPYLREKATRSYSHSHGGEGQTRGATARWSSPPGPVVPGYSKTVLLHAAPGQEETRPARPPRPGRGARQVEPQSSRPSRLRALARHLCRSLAFPFELGMAASPPRRARPWRPAGRVSSCPEAP